MSAPIERLMRLIRDWWQVDRVRISPREGRLLRLKPGDLLQLEGLTVTVTARTIDPEASGVRYRCEGAGFTGELQVGLDAGRQADEVVWSREGRQRRLPAGEVEVYPLSGSAISGSTAGVLQEAQYARIIVDQSKTFPGLSMPLGSKVRRIARR